MSLFMVLGYVDSYQKAIEEYTNNPTYSTIGLIIGILTIVAVWKMYEKAGEKGWKSLIPFYNLYIEFEIAGMNGWLMLLYFVPIANIVIHIMLCNNMSNAFGKGIGYTLGLIFFSTIFQLILGFGDAQYVGPKYGN